MHLIKDPLASLPAVHSPLSASPKLPLNQSNFHFPSAPASAHYSLYLSQHGSLQCHKLQRWANNKHRCKWETGDNTLLLDWLTLFFQLLEEKTKPQITKLGTT